MEIEEIITDQVTTITIVVDDDSQRANSTEENNEEMDIEEQKNVPLTTEDGKQNKVALIHHISIVSGIFLAFACCCPSCLIPGKNHLQEPEYWYETIIIGIICWTPLSAASINLGAVYWANISYDKIFKTFSIMYSIGAILSLLIYSSYYCIWTYALHLFAPLPFGYYTSGIIPLITMYIVLWLR